jgi:hypothetical protein
MIDHSRFLAGERQIQIVGPTSGGYVWDGRGFGQNENVPWVHVD